MGLLSAAWKVHIAEWTVRFNFSARIFCFHGPIGYGPSFCTHEVYIDPHVGPYGTLCCCAKGSQRTSWISIDCVTCVHGYMTRIFRTTNADQSDLRSLTSLLRIHAREIIGQRIVDRANGLCNTHLVTRVQWHTLYCTWLFTSRIVRSL